MTYRKTDGEMIADWMSRATRNSNGFPSDRRRKSILRHLSRCAGWVTVPLSGLSTGADSAKTRDATILGMISAGEVELRVTPLMNGERILSIHLADPNRPAEPARPAEPPPPSASQLILQAIDPVSGASMVQLARDTPSLRRSERADALLALEARGLIVKSTTDSGGRLRDFYHLAPSTPAAQAG